MEDQGKTRTGVIVLAYVAFIALGMPDGILGVAWPSIRTSFAIPLDALGMLLFSTVTGYLISSFSSGFLVFRFSVGSILAVSCAVTGAALIGYTLVPEWWMLVLLGVASGMGAGAIDSGLNAYAATHFHEGLMQWLHASYGIGATTSPIVMTMALTTHDSWRLGYGIVGGFQIALALTFLLTAPMWNRQDALHNPDRPKSLTDRRTPLTETLVQPAVWLSVSLFFFYTGAEAALGAWAFTLLTESRGIPETAAGLLAGSYWGTFTAGRILAGVWARRIGVNALIQGSMGVAAICAVLLWWNPGRVAGLLAVGLIGLAISPTFPGLVSGTAGRVGARFTSTTIGMQMSASALGAAAIPGLIGVIADQTSLEIIPLCLLVLFSGIFLLYRLSMLGPRTLS